MATGDIISVTPRADGFTADVVIEGFTTGASYNFGLDANLRPTAATPYLTVFSEGYTNGVLGTKMRRVYLVSTVRKAFPDELQDSQGPGLTKDESVSGGNLTVRVDLSDGIYDDDKNGGAGTSGGNPVAVFPSGWCTNTGGASQTSAAAAGLACTNNSTLDYPRAFGQWAVVPYQRFTSDPTLRATARHIFGIDRVAFSLSDGTNTATAIAATETTRQRTRSTLYACEHAATLSLTSLTQNTALTANHVAYPLIGDANSIFDTSTFTANNDNRALGICALPFHCDKNNALTVTKYVATTGNDTTGNGSSGNPWLTIGKALNDGTGNDIELAAGTYNVLGVSVTPASTPGYWRIVRPASGATVTVQIDGAKGFNTPHLCYEGVKVQKTVQNAWFDGGDVTPRWLWFNRCTTDKNGTGNAGVSSFGYRIGCAYLTDTTIDDALAFGMTTNTASRITHWVDGCIIGSASFGQLLGCQRFVANACENVGWRPKDGSSITSPQQDPAIIEHNRFLKCAGGPVIGLYSGSVSLTRGISIIGNIMERTTVDAPAVQVAADSSANDCDNVILAHNTIVGRDATNGRLNLAYNETGSTSRSRKNWAVKYNAGVQINHKDDTFATANANRVGGWWVGYGVSARGNVWQDTLFAPEFYGIGSKGTATLAFTNNLAASTGGGDYSLSSTSDARNRIAAGEVFVPYDLNGVAFNNAGYGSAGALQRSADVPPPDVTAPTVVSRTIDADGDTLTLVFSEAVTDVTAADFALSGATLSSATGAGDTWSMAISPVVYQGAAPTLSFTGPTVKDAAENFLANFSGEAVTNNSAVVADGYEPTGFILLNGEARNGDADGSVNGWAVGYEITPSQAVSVLRLGAFIDEATKPAWATTKRVRLYRKNDATLVASTDIVRADVGVTADYIGCVVLKEITPVELTGGVPYILQVDAYSSEKMLLVGSSNNGTEDLGGGLIAFTGTTSLFSSGSPTAMLTTGGNSAQHTYFGPTMEYEGVGAPPESKFIGFIGDSITAGTVLSNPAAESPPQKEKLALQEEGFLVVISNQGQSGSTTADWAVGGTYMNNALSAFASANVTLASIMLGTNDSKTSIFTSADTYQTRLQAICDHLVGLGYQVVLNYVPYIIPGAYGAWDATANPRIQEYNSRIDLIVDGVDILQGDTTAYDYFFANQALLTDGVHPNAVGSEWLGEAWAAALAGDGPTPTPGPATTRPQMFGFSFNF